MIENECELSDMVGDKSQTRKTLYSVESLGAKSSNHPDRMNRGYKSYRICLKWSKGWIWNDRRIEEKLDHWFGHSPKLHCLEMEWEGLRGCNYIHLSEEGTNFYHCIRKGKVGQDLGRAGFLANILYLIILHMILSTLITKITWEDCNVFHHDAVYSNP